MGSTAADQAFGLAIDENGSMWAGASSTGNLGGQTNTAIGGGYANYAGALVNFSNEGSFQFARLYGSNIDYLALGVASAAGGAIYSAGTTTASFHGQTNAGGSDGFLIKHDATGAEEWTRFIGGRFSERASGVATDASGNAYVTGQGYRPDFVGFDEYLVAKYDSSGTQVFLKYFGGSGLQNGVAIKVDLTGNIYVSGSGGGGGPGEAFLTKLDPAGNLLWTSLITGAAVARALDVDARGNVWVGGLTYQGFDGQAAGGSGDGFVAEFGSDGQMLGGHLFGTSGLDDVVGLAIGADGAAYVTGFTEANLGGASAGGADIFVARVVPEPGTALLTLGGFLVAGLTWRRSGGPRRLRD